MRPTSRLDLLIVPSDLHLEADRARRALKALVEAGLCAPDGGPGPRAGDWVPGGFARVAIDDPHRIGWWANRQGGFTVRCPAGDAPVVEAFARAMAAWREAGGPGSGLLPPVPCPACGAVHRADELVFRPAAAFGPWALVTGNAASAALAPEGAALVGREIGAHTLVLRRG